MGRNMKLLKWVGGTIALLVILVMAALAYITIGIDPNSYKQDIKRLAEQQGVAVDITGDLDWQLFPTLAIQVGETHIAGITQAIPDTTFKSARLNLDWKALLGRHIAVESIHIDDANINIKNQQQAVAAATAPAAAGTAGVEPDASADTENTAHKFSLAIERFEISNSRITLPGKIHSDTNSSAVLEDFTLSMTGLNLTGKPFALETSFNTRHPVLPDTLQVSLQADVSVDQTSQQFDASKALLKLTQADKPELEASFEVQINGTAGSLQVPTLIITSSELRAEATLEAINIHDNLQWDAQISIPAMNLHKTLTDWGVSISLPDTALQRFSLDSRMNGSTQAVTFKDLSLSLDDFSTHGTASLNLNAPKILNLQLEGTQLDLNHYTSVDRDGDSDKKSSDKSDKTGAEEAAKGETTPNAVFVPLLAPLAWLEGGSGAIDIKLEGLTVNSVDLNNVQLLSRIHDSTVELTKLSASTFGGTLLTTASINLGPHSPTLTFKQQLKGISLQQAATAFNSGVGVNGILNMDMHGASHGLTVDELNSNLTGAGQLQITQPSIATVNIEQAYCDIAALVEKIEPIQQWPTGTQLTDLDASFNLKGHQLFLDSYTTGLGNLSLRGSGVVDTRKSTFNILAITRLNGERTSENGCVVESKKIRGKDISIRCKDSFANAGVKSCGPDGDTIKQLMEATLLDKIKKETGLDDESVEALEGLLKGLFNR
ncbi:MAG: hypothetical protein DRR42_18625 [Gammaproteobacteria bacterium]|nr:MAG: hypothetical protein DRR42_18625 [Gammaproteobacteria bacterium]